LIFLWYHLINNVVIFLWVKTFLFSTLKQKFPNDLFCSFIFWWWHFCPCIKKLYFFDSFRQKHSTGICIVFLTSFSVLHFSIFFTEIQLKKKISPRKIQLSLSLTASFFLLIGRLGNQSENNNFFLNKKRALTACACRLFLSE
jgi:hypothetical protein